jgi:hypothetical protein
MTVELGILIAFIIATFVLMIGMMWVFKGWLKERSKYIDDHTD